MFYKNINASRSWILLLNVKSPLIKQQLNKNLN